MWEDPAQTLTFSVPETEAVLSKTTHFIKHTSEGQREDDPTQIYTTLLAPTPIYHT